MNHPTDPEEEDCKEHIFKYVRYKPLVAIMQGTELTGHHTVPVVQTQRFNPGGGQKFFLDLSTKIKM